MFNRIQRITVNPCAFLTSPFRIKSALSRWQGVISGAADVSANREKAVVWK